MAEAQAQGPQFVMGTPSESNPKTVKKIAGVDSYLVNYIDHEGKEQNRLVFHVPGSEVAFILQERISGQFVATKAASWFSSQVVPMINSEGDGEIESV